MKFRILLTFLLLLTTTCSASNTWRSLRFMPARRNLRDFSKIYLCASEINEPHSHNCTRSRRFSCNLHLVAQRIYDLCETVDPDDIWIFWLDTVEMHPMKVSTWKLMYTDINNWDTVPFFYRTYRLKDAYPRKTRDNIEKEFRRRTKKLIKIYKALDRGESLTAGYIRRENKRLSPQNNIYEDVTGLIEKYVGASVAQNRNESRLMSKVTKKLKRVLSKH
eukprot:218241_1